RHRHRARDTQRRAGQSRDDAVVDAFGSAPHVIVRLALRSLAVRPIRTAVLACGFGLGIAVMAALLGVGEVILEQARAPELQGGGDTVVSGAFGTIDDARFVLSALRGLRQDSGRPWIVAASPSRRTSVYLIGPEGATPVVAR